MLALGFGILLLVLLSIFNIFHQRELKQVRKEYTDEINFLVDEKVELTDQYDRVKIRLQNEELSLNDAVEEFKRDRDPDSMFPAMEGSIRECNVISNQRLLARLNKDLFGEK